MPLCPSCLNVSVLTFLSVCHIEMYLCWRTFQFVIFRCICVDVPFCVSYWNVFVLTYLSVCYVQMQSHWSAFLSVLNSRIYIWQGWVTSQRTICEQAICLTHPLSRTVWAKRCEATRGHVAGAIQTRRRESVSCCSCDFFACDYEMLALVRSHPATIGITAVYKPNLPALNPNVASRPPWQRWGLQQVRCRESQRVCACVKIWKDFYFDGMLAWDLIRKI